MARTGIDIPPERMYLLKASAKYTGINAFVAGMGATKRYVMWDTATDQLPDDEVLFVFGHESGHYVLHHIPKGFALSAVGLFFLSGRARVRGVDGAAVWSALGREGLSSRTGFVVLLFAVSIASFLFAAREQCRERHFEHQADVFGQEAIHGIVPDPQKTAVAAFNALGQSWLEGSESESVHRVLALSAIPARSTAAEFAPAHRRGVAAQVFKKLAAGYVT